MFTWYALIIFSLSILFSFFLTPFFIDIFVKGDCLEKNYKGDMVPQGIGIIFALYSFLWCSPFLILSRSISIDNIIILFAFFVASFIGFIDDMLGTRDVLGFKGHFKSLIKGRLTTGALKAIIGLFISLLVCSAFSKDFTEIVVNTLIVALSTNFMNLLDLRPGRAIKVYWVFIFALLISLGISGPSVIPLIFVPLFGSILGYMPYDLKAKSMMGDAGSNVLGISMGVLIILNLQWYSRIIALILLGAVHVFAEKYSLSEVINNNKLLRFLDNLGRS